ncbi:MAG TPA: hypothetical protein VEK34_09185 [Methylocella sp.]|nr:hypothetical protein [Methylocella sp.]
MIAARASLRALPAIHHAKSIRDFERVVALPVFRAAAIAWVAAVYLNRANKLNAVGAVEAIGNVLTNDALATATRAAARATALAAYAGVDARFAAVAPAADAARAAADAIASIASVDVNVAVSWTAVSNDASRIEEGADYSLTAEMELWPESSPPVEPPFFGQVRSSWNDLKQDLLSVGQDWDVWTNWYESFLAGRIRFDGQKVIISTIREEGELPYVDIDEDLWQQGPAAVNAEIKRRLAALQPPSTVPEIPPQRPAALEPIWENATLILPQTLVSSDGDPEALGSALKSLRAEIAEFVDDLGSDANVDRRVLAYLRRLADRIPDHSPPQNELFRIAHAKELLESYSTSADEEWPSFLAKRLHALLLYYDRTVRQFPKWREFVRNAEREHLTPQQAAQLPGLATSAIEAFSNEDAEKFIDPAIPRALQALQEPLQQNDQSAEVQLPAVIESRKASLAEDVLESINNVVKRIVEAVLRTAKDMATGYADEARKSFVEESKRLGKETGPAITRWVKRALYTGGLIEGLIHLAPSAFSWLEAIKPFLNLH